MWIVVQIDVTREGIVTRNSFATICSSPSLLRVGEQDLVGNRKDTLCDSEERTSRKHGCNIPHWRPKRVYVPSLS